MCNRLSFASIPVPPLKNLNGAWFCLPNTNHLRTPSHHRPIRVAGPDVDIRPVLYPPAIRRARDLRTLWQNDAICSKTDGRDAVPVADGRVAGQQNLTSSAEV
jgi:hypothetical protein